MNNQDRLSAYLGFCARARKLQKGYNTCLSLIQKGKVRLLIVAEDSSENTIGKMTQKCMSHHTACRVFGTRDDLSHMTGSSGNGIFAVTDGHFAKVIREEIDRIQSEGEMLNDKEGI